MARENPRMPPTTIPTVPASRPSAMPRIGSTKKGTNALAGSRHHLPIVSPTHPLPWIYPLLARVHRPPGHELPLRHRSHPCHRRADGYLRSLASLTWVWRPSTFHAFSAAIAGAYLPFVRATLAGLGAGSPQTSLAATTWPFSITTSSCRGTERAKIEWVPQILQFPVIIEGGRPSSIEPQVA
jgi:hypothetical protein